MMEIDESGIDKLAYRRWMSNIDEENNENEEIREEVFYRFNFFAKKAKEDMRRGQSLRAHIDDGGKVDQAVLTEMIFSMLHTIENLYGETK